MQVTAIVKAVKAKKPSSTPDSKAKQLTKGKEAKGCALAEVLISAIHAQCESEEKIKNNLSLKIDELKTLSREGHLAFRARIESERESFNLMRKMQAKGMANPLENEDVAEKDTLGGYGFASFAVRLSQWVKLSNAIERGYKPAKQGFNKTYADAVAFMGAHAASENPSPAKKVGRKAKPALSLLEQVQALCKQASKAELETISAWCLQASKKAVEPAPL